MIELLSRVADTITGFKGIATARCEYYTGCILYEVIPEKLKDGIPQKEQWLDEQRLKVIDKTKTQTSKLAERKRRTSIGTHRRFGGPQDSKPSRRSMPFEE